MIPYAYSYANYDDFSVWPRLEDAVKYLREWAWGPGAAGAYLNNLIEAHYPDGSRQYADLKPFVQVNEVDEVEVAAYIDRMRDEAREQDRAADEEGRRAGRKLVMVTGSAPIYMLDRQHLIDREIQQRRYSWKA